MSEVGTVGKERRAQSWIGGRGSGCPKGAQARCAGGRGIRVLGSEEWSGVEKGRAPRVSGGL